MRPEEFQAVLVRNWERIIQKKNAGGELVMKGRKRALTDLEEILLSDHIKTAGMNGHLITDNAIVTWAPDPLFFRAISIRTATGPIRHHKQGWRRQVDSLFQKEA